MELEVVCDLSLAVCVCVCVSAVILLSSQMCHGSEYHVTEHVWS